MKPTLMRAALTACEKQLQRQLRANQGARGLERIVRDALAQRLIGCETERKLDSVGARQLWNSSEGRIDIVHGDHGIEAKVVRLPRHKATASNSLYDVGQLSSDYWRLANAGGLVSAELVVLLYGPLVEDLPGPAAIYREFHNRMYVDYMTSRKYAELDISALPSLTADDRQKTGERRRQIRAIKQMGFSEPCRVQLHHVVQLRAFALVSVSVAM